MINFVGAYIVTIFLLGVLIRRPSFVVGENTLRNAPIWVHYALIVFLASLAIQEASNLLSFAFFVTIPNVLFSGLTLWVHEAGHVYFSWDGQVLHSLGGTLNEILFPCIPGVLCHFKNCQLLRSVFFFWFGYNCFGISQYMSDARAQELPLLGTGTHDWNFILGELGLLEWDTALGNCVFLLGIVVVFANLVLYLVSLHSIGEPED